VGYIGASSRPPTDPAGGGWDLFDGPENYITISKGGTVLYGSGYYENVISGGALWEANFEFSEPAATYKITVWDYDFGITADDEMGHINFTPYLQGQKFPSTINLGCAGCAVAFSLTGVLYYH
jgi:hypothetical protein